MLTPGKTLPTTTVALHLHPTHFVSRSAGCAGLILLGYNARALLDTVAPYPHNAMQHDVPSKHTACSDSSRIPPHPCRKLYRDTAFYGGRDIWAGAVAHGYRGVLLPALVHR